MATQRIRIKLKGYEFETSDVSEWTWSMDGQIISEQQIHTLQWSELTEERPYVSVLF